MPRQPRIEFEGALHHVVAKTPSGRLLFHDDLDRRRYMQLLVREIHEREWRLLTYSQLTNHLHLLIQTPETNLGVGFKRLHEDYARYINRRHSQGGHVFGGRFYSEVVFTDRHAVGCLRYIARNPVEAGMCRRAHDWPWSAHPALAGLVEPAPFLDVSAAYGLLGEDPRQARLEYLRLVAKSDHAMLAELERTDSDAWLLSAIDSFRITIPEIAAFLSVGVSTIYRRVAKARENEGTVPPFSLENLGTGPGVSAQG
jgi:putative transposase